MPSTNTILTQSGINYAQGAVNQDGHDFMARYMGCSVADYFSDDWSNFIEYVLSYITDLT